MYKSKKKRWWSKTRRGKKETPRKVKGDCRKSDRGGDAGKRSLFPINHHIMKKEGLSTLTDPRKQRIQESEGGLEEETSQVYQEGGGGSLMNVQVEEEKKKSRISGLGGRGGS